MSNASQSRAVDEQRLLRRYHEQDDLRARDELIEGAMPLVAHIARKYANRGEPLDDLIQVGTIGLIKAIDRFDASRGFKLSTFAAPNIAGEIKRHFRDRGWAVRPPRDIQELNAKISSTVDKLTVKLQRPPTVPEIAEALDATDEQVLEAMQSAQAYSTVSFEEPTGDNRTALDVLGDDDVAYDQVDARLLVDRGLGALKERDRRIIEMRFYEELTQREIAERIGISQMHVSRLLRAALEQLREQMGDAGEAATPLRHLRAA